MMNQLQHNNYLANRPNYMSVIQLVIRCRKNGRNLMIGQTENDLRKSIVSSLYQQL